VGNNRFDHTLTQSSNSAIEQAVAQRLEAIDFEFCQQAG